MSPRKDWRLRKCAPRGRSTGHLHDLVERRQRGDRVVVLRHQARDLSHRCECARGQHRARDEPAHRELAGRYQVDADHDRAHRGELLGEHRGVQRGVREQAQLRAAIGEVGGAALPAALHHALGAERLDRLESHQALDQRGVAHRAGPVGGLGELVHARPDRGRVADDEQHRDQHRQQHRPRDPADHDHERQREGQIDERRDRGGGDEVARRFEGSQVRGERTDRGRALLEAHAEHALHDVARELQVDALAGQIEKIAAHRAQREIGAEHDDDARREHPQRLRRAVGDHAVVDVHREQRQRQREQADHGGGEQHIAVERAMFQHGAPEPVALRSCRRARARARRSRRPRARGSRCRGSARRAPAR